MTAVWICILLLGLGQIALGVGLYRLTVRVIAELRVIENNFAKLEHLI